MNFPKLKARADSVRAIVSARTPFQPSNVLVNRAAICGTLRDSSIASPSISRTASLDTSVIFVISFAELALDHSNLLFVIVATPSLESGRYDHSQIEGLVTAIKGLGYNDIQKDFIICCTTMPGYCRTVADRLEPLNYRVNYNPEFIAQGTILKDQENPDMILIGESDWEAGNIIEEVYKDHTKSNPLICRMSPTEAEITKISLNCFLTTKISFANMIGDIAISSGVDPHIILKAIGSDSRIGSKYLRYGFGYGGPCFPRDNRALAIYAKDVNSPALISIASDESNHLHLNQQIKHFIENNSVDEEVVFECVTYKPQSTMFVESQELQYAVRIAKAGYSVIIRERPTVVEEIQQTYGDLFSYEYL